MIKNITIRGLIGYIKNHDIKMCKNEIDFDGRYMYEMIITGGIIWFMTTMIIVFIMGVTWQK